MGSISFLMKAHKTPVGSSAPSILIVNKWVSVHLHWYLFCLYIITFCLVWFQSTLSSTKHLKSIGIIRTGDCNQHQGCFRYWKTKGSHKAWVVSSGKLKIRFAEPCVPLKTMSVEYRIQDLVTVQSDGKTNLGDSKSDV